MAFRLGREIRHVNRWMRKEHRRWGQWVLWYEFEPHVEDPEHPFGGRDLYDEQGPQLGSGSTSGWAKPLRLPAFQVIVDDGPEQYGESGTSTRHGLVAYFNYDELLRYGLTQPGNPEAHHNDRVQYDGLLYALDHFDPQGQLGDRRRLTITVRATQVKPNERFTESEDWYG